MSLETGADLHAQLAEVRAMLAEIHGLLVRPQEKRDSYTVEEVAVILGKTSYTVREWCRHGRVNASKRAEHRGAAILWNISANEVRRIKDEGLLPPNPDRNQRN